MDHFVLLSRRTSWRVALLCAASLGIVSLGVADEDADDIEFNIEVDDDTEFIAPVSLGDHHKGILRLPLVRGAAMQPEVTTITPFGECDGQIEMIITWDEEEDWVKVRLRGKRVLEPFPDVDRTPGVNFFPNPFWPEAIDIVDGRYQFWFISPAGNITFYYDPVTLDLLGSEFDFPTPPANTIPLSIPSVNVLGSDVFQPAANGDLDITFTWTYSSMVRLDRPDLAHHRTSFPPHNLCGAHPFRYDLTSARGYMSNALPASQAATFADYLRNGMFFNITVEPAEYFVDPPLDTQTSTHSNASLFGGGIPKGYSWDIDAFFMNVAPGIKPFGGAGTCEVHFNGTHILDVNYCE